MQYQAVKLPAHCLIWSRAARVAITHLHRILQTNQPKISSHLVYLHDPGWWLPGVVKSGRTIA